MKLGGITLVDAVRMATVNAARAGRVPGREAGLAPGDRADLVQFRFDEASGGINVVATWMGGRRHVT